jgi:hypothetical protein
MKKKQFFYAFFYYLLFLDKNKKALHNRFAFNSNDPQIEHIVEKKHNEQIKQSMRGPQITQQRSPNFSGIFRYKKGV